MTDQTDESSSDEGSKMDTNIGRAICTILYPVYSVGMFLFFISESMRDIKIFPDLVSNIVQYIGKTLCYPSVYVSEKL